MEIKIHCDGGSRGNPGPSASAFIVYSKNGNIVHQEGKSLGLTTNNVAEYSSVIFALEWLSSQKNIENTVPFYLDSQLVVNQLIGVFKIKDARLLMLATKIKQLEKELKFKISYNHVLRNKNKDADLLVNETLDLQR